MSSLQSCSCPFERAIYYHVACLRAVDVVVATKQVSDAILEERGVGLGQVTNDGWGVGRAETFFLRTRTPTVVQQKKKQNKTKQKTIRTYQQEKSMLASANMFPKLFVTTEETAKPTTLTSRLPHYWLLQGGVGCFVSHSSLYIKTCFPIKQTATL